MPFNLDEGLVDDRPEFIVVFWVTGKIVVKRHRALYGSPTCRFLLNVLKLTCVVLASTAAKPILNPAAAGTVQTPDPGMGMSALACGCAWEVHSSWESSSLNGKGEAFAT